MLRELAREYGDVLKPKNIMHYVTKHSRFTDSMLKNPQIPSEAIDSAEVVNMMYMRGNLLQPHHIDKLIDYNNTVKGTNYGNALESDNINLDHFKKIVDADINHVPDGVKPALLSDRINSILGSSRYKDLTTEEFTNHLFDKYTGMLDKFDKWQRGFHNNNPKPTAHIVAHLNSAHDLIPVIKHSGKDSSNSLVTGIALHKLMRIKDADTSTMIPAATIKILHPTDNHVDIIHPHVGDDNVHIVNHELIDKLLHRNYRDLKEMNDSGIMHEDKINKLLENRRKLIRNANNIGELPGYAVAAKHDQMYDDLPMSKKYPMR